MLQRFVKSSVCATNSSLSHKAFHVGYSLVEFRKMHACHSVMHILLWKAFYRVFLRLFLGG